MSGLSFKEQLAADISKTFINEDEWGDLHTVDDRQMHVLFDEIEYNKRSQGNSKEPTKGVYSKTELVYIPVSEYGSMPKINKLITIDRKDYRITSCINEDGIYSMNLEATGL